MVYISLYKYFYIWDHSREVITFHLSKHKTLTRKRKKEKRNGRKIKLKFPFKHISRTAWSFFFPLLAVPLTLQHDFQDFSLKTLQQYIFTLQGLLLPIFIATSARTRPWHRFPHLQLFQRIKSIIWGLECSGWTRCYLKHRAWVPQQNKTKETKPL